MKNVLIYSGLLVAGLVLSQIAPSFLGDSAATVELLIRVAAMVCLSFIMIHVGYEFDIDKSRLRQYGWDYVVAATAATFPWAFCAVYFVLVLIPPEGWGQWQVWKESLLASRFAAPTSAGVLFSMLAAAGLAGTWLFRKARILAIFDDLDTVLLMIPLKMMMVGARWQLGIIIVFMLAMIAVAWKLLHKVRIPTGWPWVLGYSAVIVGVSEMIYFGSKAVDPAVPIHLEVLLPAFVLGCVMARPDGHDQHPHGAGEGIHEGPESPGERRVATIISGLFMVLVGLMMPPISAALAGAAEDVAATGLRLAGSMSWGEIAFHVLVVTVIANIGKMFPALCYRREADLRTRLALAIGLWPRGEVGAGVLVVSLAYGIGGPVVTVAMLSLALNLVLTGVFIVIIKKLLDGSTGPAPR
ncbi:MAG: sodium:proton antiporter [Phycisphaerales bacterium]|nr:sodium:proton antiporter [Phycisphaerales bacterium]